MTKRLAEQTKNKERFYVTNPDDLSELYGPYNWKDAQEQAEVLWQYDHPDSDKIKIFEVVNVYKRRKIIEDLWVKE